MDRLVRIALAVALVGFASVQLVGCSCAADRVAEELAEDATGVEVDEDGDSVTITTEGEDGEQVTITGGEGAEVPEDFPADFPLYDGSVSGASSLSTGEGSMFTVTVETADDLETIRDFFNERFAALGWTIVFANEMTQDGVTTVNFALEKSGKNGTVAITVEAGKAIVAHTVFTE